MDQYGHRKYKKISISLAAIFIFLVGFPFLSVKALNYYSNPAGKYRSEFSSPTAHTIIIDDHYHVSTTSSHSSTLAYSKNQGGREVYSISVDKLNWTDDYILVGAQSESTGKYSYMILDRATGETEGYANEEAFEIGKKEKGIEVDVLDKKYFDWH